VAFTFSAVPASSAVPRTLQATIAARIRPAGNRRQARAVHAGGPSSHASVPILLAGSESHCARRLVGGGRPSSTRCGSRRTPSMYSTIRSSAFICLRIAVAIDRADCINASPQRSSRSGSIGDRQGCRAHRRTSRAPCRSFTTAYEGHMRAATLADSRDPRASTASWRGRRLCSIACPTPTPERMSKRNGASNHLCASTLARAGQVR